MCATAALVAMVGLAACGGSGGGGSDSGNAAQVRLVNATLTHANLALLEDGEVKVATVATDTASAYTDIDSGSPTLQINDAATGTAVATVSPSLNEDDNYTLIAYETGGVVRMAVLGENASEPTTGTAVLRVVDAAIDAGAVDVYVTATGSTSTTPTFTFAASASPQESAFVSLTPGTYQVRVTAAGNPAELRLDIPSITLASQDVASVVLSPTVGGTLVNGALLVQEGAYTAARNASTRIRLVAAVTPGAQVSASAGASPIAVNAVSPTVVSYTVVPAASALTITVNGAPVAAPATALVAGSDLSLVVYGSAAAPTASLVVDDNHLPSSTANFKMRLFNGITGSPAPLTLTADFSVIASNVVPGAASGYTVVAASSSVRLDVTSSTSVVYSESNLNIPGNAVYTLFMLGDSSAPVRLLRRDR